MAEIGSSVLNLEVCEGFGHAVKPQGFQVIEGWMASMDVLSVEVIGATDVGVIDGRLLRGAGASLVVQPILHDRMD